MLNSPTQTNDHHIGDNIYVSIDGDILRLEVLHEDVLDIIYLNEDNYIALVEFIQAQQKKDPPNGTV